jgi:hypothetical protein
VKFQAFYDNGDNDASEWPSTSIDRNAKVEITYTSSTDDFELTYPTTSYPVTEVVFDKDDCIATANPDGDEGSLPEPVTLRLKFVFAPHKQSRAAPGGTNGGYEAGTWNFQFVCTDSTSSIVCNASDNGKGESSTPAWEFGYQKCTTLVGVASRTVIGSGSGGSITPNTWGYTPEFQLAWSSNGAYKISIEMKGKLTHVSQLPPGNTIDYSNTYVYEVTEYTEYGDAYQDVYKPNVFQVEEVYFQMLYGNYAIFSRYRIKVIK